MIDRKCFYCKQSGGKGPRELRPYGPGGSDVCAECVLGEKAPDKLKRMADAESAFSKQLATKGPLVLDSREQVGPRPIKKVRS